MEAVRVRSEQVRPLLVHGAHPNPAGFDSLPAVPTLYMVVLDTSPVSRPEGNRVRRSALPGSLPGTTVERPEAENKFKF